MRKINNFSTILVGVLLLVSCSLNLIDRVSATSFSVSPMNEKIALIPGDTYYGSLTITNPGVNTENFTFKTSIAPFSNADDSGNVDVEVATENYNKIVDWITILDGTGTLVPNNSQAIHYRIDVPTDAPAGGQYATILIESTTGVPVEGAINIQQQMRIAYLIYADIAGETVHDGKIQNANIQSFLLSGKIGGSSTVTNNGNTHVGATYKLQVFPLFSNEEVYTNEEEPDTSLVMPGASRFKATSWESTPSAGIFNVIYTVEFEGVTTEVKKMVIVCPLWLLFVIIFGVILVVIWLVSKNKSRKKR